MPLENTLSGLQVPQVNLFEGRAYARNLFNAIQHLYAGVGEIIDYDYIVTRLNQFHCCVRADEACSSCNQNSLLHCVVLSIYVTKLGIPYVLSKKNGMFFRKTPRFCYLIVSKSAFHTPYLSLFSDAEEFLQTVVHTAESHEGHGQQTRRDEGDAHALYPLGNGHT